jgi:acetolactate synthase-1/2/3 large subunit
MAYKSVAFAFSAGIGALAGSVSCWVRRSARSADVAADAAEAQVAAATPPGGVATLILPADVSWSGGAEPAPPAVAKAPAPVPDEVVRSAAATLRSGEPSVLFLGSEGTRRRALEAASRIAQATGARILCETFPARHQRGAGIPAAERLAYLAELAVSQLAGARHLILAGARAPVSFFAYPGKPSSLVPDGCAVHSLADDADDVCGALESLADLVAPDARPMAQPRERTALPGGSLTAETAAAVIGALLPEDAIVCDEANTSGVWLPAATAGAPPHDWLTLTGGAIGQGLPLAAGAAVACPGRRVLALEADGSAMYTISALWTHAREELDITTVIFSNQSYAILEMELERVGALPAGPVATAAGAGAAEAAVGSGDHKAARSLLDLSRPCLDFVSLASGMGVPATRAATAGEFATQLRRALAEPGPNLIEAVIPPSG